MRKILYIMMCALSFFCLTAADASLETKLQNFAYPSSIPAEIRRRIDSDAVSFLAELKQVLAAGRLYAAKPCNAAYRSRIHN